ncbi:nuclear pore complex protein Nup214 [Hylaeus anthracinus]|uniref:nuclear pore complex protein Nup214 n=1 Tax=Hylaeus anthracinus TaxID=313031 RepID=UPI0023B9C6CE|nr:nuclear pore complex protein Nup214 [Hylaeus anthracinus]
MKTAPDPKDVQEFQFKQSHISQILNAYESIPIACNLLAADKKRALLYIGQNNKINILKPGEDSDPEWKVEVNIPVFVSKLALSCDCSYLAVVPHGPSILIYNAQMLARGNLQLLHEIRISSSSTEVFANDLQWNPTVPGMFCTVASDYTVGCFQIKEEKEKTIELKALEKLNGLDVLCAAWSPKGKQVAVGCKNGNIVQLKPDLKVARTIPGPTPYIGEVISMLWIRNYQFCAAYLCSEQRINVLIIDAPKGETNANFTSYEDITYGMSDTESEAMIRRYYFDHVPEWGLIIAASSNSSEIAVLGSTDAGATWNQWQLVDSGRAELPLIHTKESYPVGLAIDKTPVRKLPWGADSILPHPVPILHILATSGQLCSFHMVNLTPTCPAINSPPTEMITPPPQPQLNVSSEASLIMNGVITSTPRPKQPENVPDRPKPPPVANIFGKLNTGSGFFPQSPTEKPKQQEQKFEPIKETHLQQPVNQDIKLTAVKETSLQEPEEQKTSVEDDSRDIRAQIEEYNLFEKELRSRLEPQTWECGTEEERLKLVDTSAKIDEFLRELRETTNSLSSDIAYLKALLLQSFAWVEETKSKNAATIDIVTRNCGDNKISDLHKLYYYTQTQLTRASQILDLEWSDRKTQELSRMKIPHLEFVYQNLILHNKIIQEEKGNIEHLKKRWKLMTRNNNIFGLNRSLSNLSITSSKSSMSLPRNAGIIEARCKAIATKTLSFTQGKQIKLREHLSASTPRIIKPDEPTPIQHRLEETLSSLAALDTTSIDPKNDVEQLVSKQTVVIAQAAEKPKQQSYLASLNSIVARIGTSETNNVSTQSKAQTKQPAFSIAFPAVAGSKPLPVDKKLSSPVTNAVPQTTKSKPDTITFNQVNTSTHTMPNILKSFPKVDSITFGTPIQKPEETLTQKSVPKEFGIKLGKDVIPGSDSFKVDTNLFSTNTLKDALSPEISLGNVQGIASNTSLKFGASTTTPAKTDSTATFSFATPLPSNIYSTSQNITPQTSAQTFSFASKPSSTATPFNVKLTPSATVAQTQEALQLTPSFAGQQAADQISNVSSSTPSDEEKYAYKSSFRMLSFQTSLGQISMNLASGVPSKETAATTSLPAIEKTSSTESKVPVFSTSPVQTLLPTSATSLFGNQTNASSISIFGGMSSSTPTTSTFTVTTSSTAFGIQSTTSAPMSIFGGFKTTPATSVTTSTVAATSTAISPFQTSLSKSTFGEPVASLSPASSTSPNNGTPPTFGNATTTSDTSVFGKPTLAINAQFPNTPAVSSAANTFGKPVINAPSMPFGSSPNTSIFASMPTTSANTSIFSGSSTSSIFGTNTPATSAGSIFEGNPSQMNAFGTPQKSIFDNNPQKSTSIFGGTPNTGSTTSFFGGAASNATPGTSSGSPSVFGGIGASTSPIGLEQPVIGAQPAFGQPPAFDSKPVFGSASSFGTTKSIFGGGFGATAFGASASPPAFGSPAAMGGSPAPMDNMSKVFGNVEAGNTFESLASQPGGLSFSSLAQKSPEAEKLQSFSGGSSFSSWR